MATIKPPSGGATAPLDVATLPPQALQRLRDELKFDDAQIADLVEAVNDGAGCAGDYLGLGEGGANTLEATALAYYRAQRYDLAIPVYQFLTEMFPRRASAWRGLGAAAQASKVYEAAIAAYVMGLEIEPGEVAMQVLLGECFCLSGRRKNGLAALQHALTLKVEYSWQRPFVRRAEQILLAQGNVRLDIPEAAPTGGPASGAPTGGAKKRPGGAAAAAGPAAAGAGPSTPDDDDMQTRIDARMKIFGHIEGAAENIAALESPEMRALVQKIDAAVRNEVLTVKQVAGFSDAQLHGGYVAACAYLEQGQPQRALEILGWLLYIDGKNAKFLQLAGLAAHHLKMYCYADYLYGIALIYAPEEPRTLIYRGEAKIMSQERHAGVELLQRGVTLCGAQGDLQDVAARGAALLKQFSAPQSSHSTSSMRTP